MSANESPTGRCPHCGSEFSPNAPGSVCPTCAFGDAVAEAPTERGAGELSLDDIPLPGTMRVSPAAAGDEKPHQLHPPHRSIRNKPGDRIGRYKLLEELGEGGCGVVHVAEQEQPVRRRVALKVIKLGMDTREVIARFEAERQALAMMDHPNIARVLDAGATETGRPYFIMELVKGVRITDYCDRNNLPTTERIELFIQVCHAIQHAHQKGIIHRDIKPSNILVTLHDGVPVPKVIDFGIAKSTTNLRLTDKTVYTAIEQFIGTPAYMSPEQAELTGLDIDTRSDIYALGVLLYELLTGLTPFDAQRLRKAGLDEIRRIIREEEPPRPSTRISTLTDAEQTDIAKHRHSEPLRLLGIIRGDLDWIVMKTLEKDRARRYGTADALAMDIRRYLENEPIVARPPSQLYRFQKLVRRNKLAFGATAAILLSLMLGLGTLAIAQGLKTQRDVARQLTALRSAELASRNGQWREALRHWDEAEAAGYHDTVHLNLQRAEAWTVLNERSHSQLLLTRLARRADLGDQSGVVLLRLGERELFDPRNSSQGLAHVREALAQSLPDAERAFARGLLADSTPAALDGLREALRLNPYHHGAHRHSLGLESLLGRHTEVATHVRLFKVLYPDDPSSSFLQAHELAKQGRLAEAEAQLAAVSGAVNPELYQRVASNLRALALMAEWFDVEKFLRTGESPGAWLNQLTTELTRGAIFAAMSHAAGPMEGVRQSQLPCLRQGLIEGGAAIGALLLPGSSDPEIAVKQVKTSWQHHPEALLPVLAATHLELLQPRAGPRSVPVLRLQADLFQLAADSPAIIPALEKFARFIAASMHFELATRGQSDAATARSACLAQVRRAAGAEDTSVAECRAYADFALKLQDYELARALLDRWERRAPHEDLAARQRIELEVVAGAFGAALERIEKLLADSPADDWARTQREAIVAKLKSFIETTQQP